MKFASLGSGSKGNSTVVRSGRTSILIDCGFNRKHTRLRLQELKSDLSDLDAIVVTHEHSDHAKGVALVCESVKKPFYSTYGTARAAGWLHHPLWRCIDSHTSFSVNDLEVTPVIVPHDSEEPVQFVVSDGQYKVGALSDLGSVTPHVVEGFSGCHGLLLEANHDVQLLQQGPYPPSLKVRVAGDYGHLNNLQSADLLSRIKWAGMRHIMASHISEKNNHPDIVRQSLAPVLNCSTGEVDLADQGVSSGWREIK